MKKKGYRDLIRERMSGMNAEQMRDLIDLYHAKAAKLLADGHNWGATAHTRCGYAAEEQMHALLG
jgi:hypothetical protein